MKAQFTRLFGRTRFDSRTKQSAMQRLLQRHLFVERLEDRRVLATLYVDNAADFIITSDIGDPGLSVGDTVTFNAGVASQHGAPVAGLEFGTDAFASIQAAVDAATAGDTIRVGPGTFSESVTVNTQVELLGNQAGVDAQSALRIGLPVTETVVTGVGNGGETPIDINADGVIVDGLTIEGATSGTTFGFGIRLAAGTSGSQIRNNIVQNNVAGIGLANDSASSQTVIENNLFVNNNQPGAASGNAIYSDQYVAGGAVTNVLISENTFIANANAAVAIVPSDSTQAASDIEISSNTMAYNGSGVVLQNTVDSSIEFNTIIGSTDAQIALLGGVEGPSIEGNFIVEGGDDGILILATGGATANEDVTILGNSIESNAGAGLRVESGGYDGTLSAEFNWWGSSTGPTHLLNVGGTGQAIVSPSNLVDFEPFLTELIDSLPGVPGLQVIAGDLSISKTASATTAVPGGTVTYTIVVTNEGPDAQTGVTVVDTISAQLTDVTFTSVASAGAEGNTVSGSGSINDTVSLEAGSTITYTVTGTILPSASGSLSNTATVTAAENTIELDSSDNSAEVSVTLEPEADLSITKTAAAGTVVAGDLITYTIVVANTGLSDAENVVLSDIVPTGTTFVSLSTVAGWTNTAPAVGATGNISSSIDTLAAGATATFTLIVRADETLTTGATVTNTATIDALTEDPDEVDNTTTATVAVRSPGLVDCEVVTLNVEGSANTAVRVDDADFSGKKVLVVTGSTKNDSITIEPVRGTSQIRVRIGREVTTFESAEVPRIVVFGLSGNDTIRIHSSLSQDVVMFGGAGNDTLYAAGGNDAVDGGTGNDRLYGGLGNDVLCGGDGNDSLYGQAGNDLLGGGSGNDRLYGDVGDDQLLGGVGNDTLSGGLGDDRLYGEEGNDSLSADAGADIVVGGGGNDRINGGAGLDLLIGGDGSDTISGGTDADILIGGSTDHDEDDEALLDLLAEWSSSAEYNLRLANLQLGGGLNGALTLSSSTVSDDGDADTLLGQSGQDWLFSGNRDRLRDRVSNEVIS